MHSKNFSVEDSFIIGADRIQRNFEPLRCADGDRLPSPSTRRVLELYFSPPHEDFQPRTMWSLSNAFTSAFKELDPIPQFKDTAKLGAFLEAVAGA